MKKNYIYKKYPKRIYIKKKYALQNIFIKKRFIPTKKWENINIFTFTPIKNNNLLLFPKSLSIFPLVFFFSKSIVHFVL